jgi:hypothetical protein
MVVQGDSTDADIFLSVFLPDDHHRRRPIADCLSLKYYLSNSF